MTVVVLKVDPYGDAALLVQAPGVSRAVAWTAVHRLSDALRAQAMPGIENVVATFDTLLVSFDPLVARPRFVEDWLLEHAPSVENTLDTGRTIRIPVHYGPESGPDLTDVAAELGVSADDFVERHASASWRVAFNGAPAGAPLHEGSPFSAPIQRMRSPRIRIEAGTIALAGFEGTIYTVPSPGGWRLIGRTPLAIVNPVGQPFVAIEPGDRLQFFPISAREFATTEPRFIGDTA